MEVSVKVVKVLLNVEEKIKHVLIFKKYISIKHTMNSLKRRASQIDDREALEYPLSAEYENKVRDAYPFRSSANEYRYLAVNQRYHDRSDDPSANIPPAKLPEILDFTLLSADTICKYWSLKENGTLNLKSIRIAVGQYNVSPTYIALTAGLVTAYATYAVFGAVGVAVARGLYNLDVTSTWVEPLTLIANAAKYVIPVGGTFGTSMIMANVGHVSGRAASDFVESKMKERRKKKHDCLQLMSILI